MSDIRTQEKAYDALSYDGINTKPISNKENQSNNRVIEIIHNEVVSEHLSPRSKAEMQEFSNKLLEAIESSK